MARMSRWTAIFSVVCMSASLVALAAATPTVTFPFNSQVPLVARKNQFYQYQLSRSTFEPQQGLSYSLSQQPAWLSIDGSNRTLLGTPGEADVGSSTFTITATDGTGSARMQCTLVIASDPAPRLQGDFTLQLAAESNLSSSTPPTVALTPGTQFNFQFRQDSFIDVVQRRLYYYATLTDHTPLPAWLLFDPNSLSFSGVAPQLSAFPQSFQVSLVASDYQGFSGASADFTLVIATQQLAFVPSTQTVRYTPNTFLNYSLAQSIFLNGRQISINDLASATAALPSWASFDSKSGLITGTAPQDGAQNGSVTVVDGQGNRAQVALQFTVSNGSIFMGTIGTITATAGQNLDYPIPTSVLNEADVSLSLNAPSNAGWLSLDSSARIIRGLVPADAAGTLVSATLAAKASTIQDAQTQAFQINITDSATNPASSTTTAAVPASSTSSRLSGGSIAAIVICSILGALILLALIFCCCICRRRRRRQREYVRDTPSPQKRLISGPTLITKHPDMITVTTQVQSDVEKNRISDERELADEDRPPQLALDIPATQARSSKLGARASGFSQVSSIGNGEDAIRRDDNIPEWGSQSSALHKPHDSFSVPVEMARAGSKHYRSMSPSKRALRRAQDKYKKQSIGLGIDTTGESSGAPGRNKSARVNKKISSTGLSATLDRSSCASLSTQATSLLSTKPSDFPRPPTQSTFSLGSRNLSAVDPEHRKSIRMLRRSDSINDSRPIELRRESFIRARASTSLQSPLFSHGSRNPLEARGRGSSSDVSSGLLNRLRSRRRGQRSSYSQSSLDRSESDCRRLSQRVRSTFAPNFPRVVSSPDEEQYAVEDDKDEEWEDITPSHSRHQSLHEDLAAEMAKPRHQRSWVLPGEASPTPPPPAASLRLSRSRRGVPESRWKQRVNTSSSPLARSINHGIEEEETSPTIPKKSPKRYSYVNEPLGLISKDSFNRSKDTQRPRLGDTKTSRPVSVDEVERLSSLKAETMDTLGGSEMMEDDEQGTGLMGPSHALHNIEGTQRSAVSGKAFL